MQVGASGRGPSCRTLTRERGRQDVWYLTAKSRVSIHALCGRVVKAVALVKRHHGFKSWWRILKRKNRWNAVWRVVNICPSGACVIPLLFFLKVTCSSPETPKPWFCPRNPYMDGCFSYRSALRTGPLARVPRATQAHMPHLIVPMPPMPPATHGAWWRVSCPTQSAGRDHLCIPKLLSPVSPLPWGLGIRNPFSYDESEYIPSL